MQNALKLLQAVVELQENIALYTYWYKIQQCLLKALTNAIQPLTQKLSTNKFYTQIFLFKNIQRKTAIKFFLTLVLLLALENFISAKPIQKYLNMFQSYSIGCSLAHHDTKDPIVMQIRLLARSALSGYNQI